MIHQFFCSAIDTEEGYKACPWEISRSEYIELPVVVERNVVTVF
jgi:hypothetical protein